MNWNPDSRPNAAIRGGALGLLCSNAVIILYAAVTSAPDSLRLPAALIAAALLTAAGYGLSRALRPVSVRHAMSLPFLMGLMAHGAAHSPALMLAATLLLTTTIRPARPALHLPFMTLVITSMLGLSVQLQGGVTLSALITLTLPFAALLLARPPAPLPSRRERRPFEGAPHRALSALTRTLALATPERADLLALTATLITGALSLQASPAAATFLLITVAALHAPSELLQQIRHVTLRKRHVPPGHVDASVTEKH